MAIDFLGGCEFKTQTEKYALNKTEYKKIIQQFVLLSYCKCNPKMGRGIIFTVTSGTL